MKNLIALLDKTSALTLELLDVLDEEKASLSRQDIATLETIIEKKLAIAQALQGVDRQRDDALVKLGAAPGLAGMEALLASHPEPQLQASWQALCEVSRRCKQDNLLAGTMIRKNQMVTDQALQVLRQGSIETAQTYSANGLTPQRSQSSPLGKA
ncbi:MAG: flagellar protein FlgN [Gammaproteobacteria bacterium]|nr:flagellar protein FlgN [Gammaproteobacteria bacterium]MBQ0839501.1 flagellar protein FlgN [Gammaproteobacteria bacterium]